jgi:hypothetical protein
MEIWNKCGSWSCRLRYNLQDTYKRVYTEDRDNRFLRNFGKPSTVGRNNQDDLKPWFHHRENLKSHTTRLNLLAYGIFMLLPQFKCGLEMEHRYIFSEDWLPTFSLMILEKDFGTPDWPQCAVLIIGPHDEVRVEFLPGKKTKHFQPPTQHTKLTWVLRP